MAPKVIDACGKLCPKPLIMTKKALKDNRPFLIKVDDQTARENISQFLQDNHIPFSMMENNGIYEIDVEIIPLEYKDYSDAKEQREALKKTTPDHVICIKNNKMGHGPEELGDLLIKGFINTIKEVNPLPTSIVLYNSGVLLAQEDSDVLESLLELEKMGIKILVCGTCANYFELKDKIKVGTISNMYTILQVLSHAGHVVIP
ncbi:MAG: sulfurtransferase-like selenium metabolism protein YedF [Spirochaetes bacterium]|nr:sulfurtransferase-like selenium metabolism protein YedF [Spirochaetota bacterium]